MARFITEADYEMQIRQEIIKIVTSAEAWFITTKLVRAEQTAISQIRNRIGKRYDCNAIFSAANNPDVRDQWIVTITIDIALYHLYSRGGMKDLPEHRAQRYQDAIDWLKDVGNGSTTADLPVVIDSAGDEYSEVRIWGREPINHKY